jgi:putative SOS response-associated peptidase YedK
MCGRYALVTDSEKIKQRFGLTHSPAFSARYNVAPGSSMPVVLSENPKTAVLARWGLVPFWAKDPKIGYRMINARAETVTEKPAFRRPFMTKRCLVPASGFYEWKPLRQAQGESIHGNKGKPEKVPFHIKLKDDTVFSFAGLYDTWKDAEGMEITTFTIITTTPNETVMNIHDRMPVILEERSESVWLDTKGQDRAALHRLLKPFPAARVDAYPVSTAVNDPSNDDATILAPGHQATGVPERLI